jgi:hypothetical protein
MHKVFRNAALAVLAAGPPPRPLAPEERNPGAPPRG